ncbi:MAG: hypothetical protein CMB80_16485 [Flammeovirgaceae bacterium]|nr:hypothetical protein [Flammeovirgaceae bacterium]
MTYEYRCKNCDHTWTLSQKITDEAVKNCPACNKETAMRLISGGQGFVLKGQGWFNKGGY